MRLVILGLIAIVSLPAPCQTVGEEAQTIFGKWNSIDAETGKPEAIIEVFKENNKAYAKIIDILNPEDKDTVCVNCKGKNKNKPILGLTILDGLIEDGDEWSGGIIIDPKNGNNYKCYLKLIDASNLKIRGYIGISLFGRTEYWKRIKK